MWWKNSVVYQIYPKSFMDSNDDGIGDLKGIISKLDYLAYLGVDVIWLCPIYDSPNEDNGYDISNYYEISIEYGTMSDMENLIHQASLCGISIMMDIVANHTSTKHQWFQEAIKSKNDPKHQYYVFQKNQGEVPSNLQSVFLDSAWELISDIDEYYLHLFAKGQADLNWHFQPVRESMYDVLNFWINKGVRGFRFDVIDLIGKKLIDGKLVYDDSILHKYIREMNQKVLSKHDLITVGETWGATVEKAKLYSNNDNSEFSMIFNFSHILLDQEKGKEKWDIIPLDLIELKKVFKEQQIGLFQKGWNSLFWNNHDLPRIVSRWGNDKEYRVESAKMLAILLHFMQGTPYIYQGEELGMTNIKFDSIDEMRDIETFNLIKQRLNQGFDISDILHAIECKGRDNARTPYQWNSDQYAGFSKHNPWIKCNSNYVSINMESQKGNPDSILECYRKLILLRHSEELSDIIEKGKFELIFEHHPHLFAYKRFLLGRTITVLCNFYSQDLDIECDTENAKIIVSNYKDSIITKRIHLRSYESIAMIQNI